MTKRGFDLWPPSVEMTFRNGRGKVYFRSSDRRLDLADSLMLHHWYETRTVYMGMRTTSPKWPSWSDERVAEIEKMIRGDICFDGYRLTLSRQNSPSEDFPCSLEFCWKLFIRS